MNMDLRSIPSTKKCTFLLAFLTAQIFFEGASWPQPIQINEILAHNESGIQDADGERSDWVELHNPGSTEVNLGGFFITDDPDDQRPWTFPEARIPPGGFLLLWASGKDRRDITRELHLDFGLSRIGETLILFNATSEVVDRLDFGPQHRDMSLGRRPDGGGVWLFFEDPTPGEPNSGIGGEGIVEEVLFSPERGFFGGSIKVALAVATVGAQIRYTLDGSEPGPQSELYDGPLPLDTSTVVRARAFRDRFIPSRTATHTYLIGEEASLDAVSLSSSRRSFFDPETGIYANPEERGQAWERPVSLELLPGNGSGAAALQIDCGVRIHGGGSRQASPKKSFRLYFRSEYGYPRLRSRLFPGTELDSFNGVVLRAGHIDSWGTVYENARLHATFVRDQVARELHRDMGHLASAGTFVNLFINGTYWGIYNACERLDGDFLESHLGIPDGEWDLITPEYRPAARGFVLEEEAKEGNLDEWNRLRAFVRKSDLREPDAYSTIKSLVDLEGFTDYFILNIWLQNYDWPHQNWYAARPRAPGTRWVFLAWDVESSFGAGTGSWSYSHNTFEAARNGRVHLQNGTDFRSTIAQLFDKLLDNPHYQDLLLNRLNLHINGALDPSGNIPGRLRAALDTIEPAVKSEERRWGASRPGSPPMGYDAWKAAAAEELDVFVPNRTSVVLDHLRAKIPSTPRPFRRGDSNGDGQSDVSDAVRTLSYLFLGETPLECDSAADTDDSGTLDITDPIFFLEYLFLGQRSGLPKPFPDCGNDGTPGALSCELSACP